MDLTVWGARQQVTVEILVRNRELIAYYLENGFDALPAYAVNAIFFVCDKLDPQKRFSRENFWSVIPHFISALTVEQFRDFMKDLEGIGIRVYAEADKLISTSRPTLDDYRADRQRENNGSTSTPDTSNEEAYTSSDTGH